ncbi:MAG: response regulator transcription factor [Alphaproteobacteria bacterium]|nr:response regulator transcription factor [Alphaproteobacteria bacterium]
MRTKKSIILVVDSDPQTYKILDIVLDKQDFVLEACEHGKQAVRMCVSLKPDLMLLDLAMPDISGREIIAALREWSQMPVIIISKKDGNDDVINGLDLGADDYVIKPFNPDVLRARINASLRKAVIQQTGVPELANGPLRIDLVRHEVFLADELISFTPKEYSLVHYFITHSGKMLGHREILNEVWGPAHSDDKQYLRVFIGQIREKIEKDPANPLIITTELGIGYRMEILDSASVNLQGELRL